MRIIKQVFSEQKYAPQLQFESASILTALYCVSINYFKGEHAQTQFRSNFEITKCCGYGEGQDQESIQSSTTPDPRYQWESDKLTVDTTNESQEVSPYPAGDHKAHINGRAQRHSKHKTEQKHKRSTKEVPPTKENPYFGQNLTFQSAGVTLKIRSGSPKSS